MFLKINAKNIKEIFKILDLIIFKIKSSEPTINNITGILGDENGKNIISVLNLIFYNE